MTERNRLNNRWFWISAFIIVIALTMIHLYRLGELPNGFFVDESAIGYNAWCIAETGADEYGQRTSLFFRAFDNYHDPVMVYALAPLTSRLGLEKWVVRLPSVMFHVLAALMLGLLVHEYVRTRWLALGAVFCFGLLPWVLPISRTTMSGYTPMLLGVATGWWALVRAVSRRRVWLAVLAGVGWAFAMYSHNIGRPTTALTLLCFGLAYGTLMLKRWRILAIFAIVFVILMLPMVINLSSQPAALTERFSKISVFHDEPAITIAAQRIIERYVEYFGPGFLFFTGDANPRHHTGFGGMLFLSMFPLVLAGIGALLNRRDARYRFLLLAWLAYPLAACLTLDHMHATRCINGAVSWCLLSAVGGRYLWQWRMGRRFVAMLSVIMVVETAAYLTDYFGAYEQRSRMAFDAPFTEALEGAFATAGENETVYLSRSIFQGDVDKSFKPHYYAHICFFGRIAPATYQQSGIPPELVAPYTGEIIRPGVLVRSSHHMIYDSAGMRVMPNREPLPRGAVLADEYVVDRHVVLQLYRVPGNASSEH